MNTKQTNPAPYSAKESQDRWDNIPAIGLDEGAGDIPILEMHPVTAKRALTQAYGSTRFEAEDNIGDLIADMHHLCDHLGLDWDAMLQQSERTYAGDFEDSE